MDTTELLKGGALLGCAGGGVDTTELLKGGGSWVFRSVAGRRSGSNIYSVSLLGGDFASGCLHAVGLVGVIAGVGCCGSLGLRSANGEPPESVVSGEVGGSPRRPPIMRPGT